MSIKAEIIAIGDEILLGQTKDTNSNWLATQLTKIGVSLTRINVISDNKNDILTSLQESQNRSNIVIVTGGLGPTKDDLTKHTLCLYFNTELTLDKERLQELKTYYNNRGKELNELNKTQAYLPSCASKITNLVGTANGMVFYKNNTLFISLPGVPNEMQFLMLNGGLEKIKSRFQLPKIVYQTIKTIGIPESNLALLLQDWESNLPNSIKLAYLPSLLIVKLRLSCISDDINDGNTMIEAEVNKLQKIIGEFIFTKRNISLEEHIVEKLTQKSVTLASAESCTGGKIGEKITAIPGASKIYLGGIIAYSNLIKAKELDIPSSILETHGAVSEATVKLMAKNIRLKYNSTFGIATSGIAGPTGGTPKKPVGTIWIALATKNEVITKKLLLTHNRTLNTEFTTLEALNLIRTTLNKF